MASKRYAFEPDYAVPPGNTLIELLDSLGINQAELARRTDRPKKTISGIVRGNVSITADTALQFEKVLGMPASFWLNLEYNYQESLARIKEKEELAGALEWVKQIPVKEMQRYGWIKETNKPIELAQELLSFFGVANVAAWENQWCSPEATYRKSPVFSLNPGSVAAWLRKGELGAQKIKTESFNKFNFLSALEAIRDLTVTTPEIFELQMVKLCADSGVALVFTKELSKCPVYGATRWLSPKKALIQMSLRYKFNDHFWFTFFHEAGHIIKHGKRDAFIDTKKINNDDKKEEEANKFARDYLIPPSEYKQFTALTPISEAKVRKFAEKIEIHPGIVVGRLQHDGHIPYSHLNRLKDKFRWA